MTAEEKLEQVRVFCRETTSDEDAQMYLETIAEFIEDA